MVTGPAAIDTNTFVVTLTFSEDVTGFIQSDITILNGR